MTTPLDPLRPVDGGDRRRRAPDRRDAAEAAPPLAVPAAPDPATPPPPEMRRSGLSEFFAQLLGQGQRRGLKGGQTTLDDARSTYLGAEYSGDADRRPRKGAITRDV